MKRILLPLVCLLFSHASFSQDLVIIDRSVPSQITRYTTPAITVKLANQGIINVEEYTDVYAYLSLDGKVDVNDQFIGSATAAPLAANTSEDFSLYTSLAKVTPGSYLLLMKVDYNSLVTETNETNNLTIVPVTILPAQLDFMMSSLDAVNTSIPKGDVLNLDYGVANVGTTSTDGAVAVTFFLSADETFDAGDLYLNNVYNYLTDGSAIGNIELTIPNVNTGMYNLLAIANGPSIFQGERDYDEADVTNNFASIAIEITPPDIDLIGTEFLEASIAQASPYGESYDVKASFVIRNNGTTPATGVGIKFYLSDDDQLSGDDRFVGLDVLSFEKIEGGGERVIDYQQPQPFLVPGTYYMIASINPSNEIEETDYTNNTISFYPVEVAPIELIYVEMTDAKLAEPVFSSDNELMLDLTFQNPSPGDYDHAPWISLTLKNSLAVEQGITWNYPSLSLPKDQQKVITVPVALTTNLPLGNYTLNVRSEHGTDKNITFTVAASHKLTGIINGEDGPAIKDGTLYLYRKDSSGKIRLVKQYAVTGTNAYTADFNASQHTLYFVPDPDLHPGYVPTIFNQVVTIGDATFFSATQNIVRNVKVLKINPLAPGEMTITGTIDDPENSGGRGNARIDDVAVILLNEAGDVVGLTHTNDDGYFEFTNLPAGIYQVVISMSPSDISGAEPVSADVTEYDGRVVFEFEGQTVNAISKSVSSVALSAFGENTYGDANFTPEVTSNTDQPLTLESSNPTVAVVEENGDIKIVGAGTTVISAKLEETDDFFSATSQQELIVSKADQEINFASMDPVTVGEQPPLLEATTTFGLDVVFTSSNPAVATIDGDELTIHDAGTTEITASQSGNDNINPANPVTHTLQVDEITGVERTTTAKVFPNPTAGKVNVEGFRHVTKIDLVNSLGLTVKTFAGTSQLDLSAFPSGLYFLRLHSNTGKSLVRVVKE